MEENEIKKIMNFSFEMLSQYYKDNITKICSDGKYKLLEYLLRKNIGDVNFTEKETNTSLLHIATKTSNFAIVELLLKNNANANRRDFENKSVLEIAEENAKENPKDDVAIQIIKIIKERLFFNASVVGDFDTISQLIHGSSIDINLLDKIGIRGQFTALMYASQRGHVAIVDKLIESGADINKCTDWNALHLASENGHINIVNKLIDAKIDVNIINKTGDTALIIASKNGNTGIVNALIESGADVNIEKKTGATALIAASIFGHINVVNALIDAKANVNIIDKTEGDTALISASKFGHINVVNALIDAKADVNIINKKGDTALTILSEKHLKMMNKLTDNAGRSVSIDLSRADISEFINNYRYNYDEKKVDEIKKRNDEIKLVCNKLNQDFLIAYKNWNEIKLKKNKNKNKNKKLNNIEEHHPIIDHLINREPLKTPWVKKVNDDKSLLFTNSTNNKQIMIGKSLIESNNISEIEYEIIIRNAEIERPPPPPPPKEMLPPPPKEMLPPPPKERPPPPPPIEMLPPPPPIEIPPQSNEVLANILVTMSNEPTKKSNKRKAQPKDSEPKSKKKKRW
jgi:ankyrin repeat protein